MTANLPAPPNLTTLTPSPELWSLLATGPKENAEAIRLSPALRAEAGRSFRQLEVLCEPAGNQVVMAALAPLILVYGKGEEARSPAFWKVYTDALSDLPRIALDRAVKGYERIGKFFPKPAEIRELAMPHADTFRQAAYRAKKAQEAEVIQLRPPVDQRPTADEVAAMMKEFHALMEAKCPVPQYKTKPGRATPSARVDNTGVSPEMRALLARTHQ